MDSVALVVQMLSGFIGANATRLIFKNLNLDFLRTSLAGMLGGFLGDQLLQLLLGFGLNADDKLDLQLLLTSAAGGAMIGAVVVIVLVTWTNCSRSEEY